MDKWDSRDLLSKTLLLVSLFNLRNPSAYKSNFHSTSYSFISPSDRVLRTINNVNNIIAFYPTSYLI